MTQGYFRDLLEGNPALLAEIVRFNLSGREQDSRPEGAHALALQNHPEVLEALRRRTKQPARAGFWGFAAVPERLALLPPAELSQLGRMAAAAVCADELAGLLTRADVEAAREAIGADTLHWALVRGRFLIGTLAADLRTASGDAPLIEKLERLPRGLIAGVAEGWPEALREAAAPRLAAMDLPEAAPIVLDADLRRRTCHFIRKLIYRELDAKWTPYFD